MYYAGGNQQIHALYQEEILNVDHLGYVYLEKCTLVLNEQDVREWIGLMSEDGQQRAGMKEYGVIIGYLNG